MSLKVFSKPGQVLNAKPVIAWSECHANNFPESQESGTDALFRFFLNKKVGENLDFILFFFLKYLIAETDAALPPAVLVIKIDDLTIAIKTFVRTRCKLQI